MVKRSDFKIIGTFRGIEFCSIIIMYIMWRVYLILKCTWIFHKKNTFEAISLFKCCLVELSIFLTLAWNMCVWTLKFKENCRQYCPSVCIEKALFAPFLPYIFLIALYSQIQLCGFSWKSSDDFFLLLFLFPPNVLTTLSLLTVLYLHSST